MIELLIYTGGLATGLLAGLWAARHLPAGWFGSTASEPRPEPPWELDARALEMAIDDWESGQLRVSDVPTTIRAAPEPRRDVETMSPREWRRQTS